MEKQSAMDLEVAPSPNEGTVVSNGQECLLVRESEIQHVDKPGLDSDAQRESQRQVHQSPHAVPTLPTSTPAPDVGEEVRDFDWRADMADVVVPEQQAIAAYLNGDDNLVLRQENYWDREQDSIIIVHKQNVSAFIHKLTDLLGYGSAP